MLGSLQSSSFCADMSEKGLLALYSKKTKVEYLRHNNKMSHVLFPFANINETQKFMSSLDCTVKKEGVSSYVFSYKDTDESRAMYPFSFDLQVIYTLEWNVIETIYHIDNKTADTMHFFCGDCTSFICPRDTDESLADYYLEFDRDSVYKGYTTQPSEPTTFLEDERRLQPLGGDLVFTNIPSNKVVLGSDKSRAKIEIVYDNAPNLSVSYSETNTALAITPMFGLPNTDDKKIVSLEKNGAFGWRRNISVYE